MEFSDAFSSEIGYGPGTPATVSGFLVVGFLFSYLVADRADERSSQRPPAILLADSRLADKLAAAGCPVAVGTMVVFAGGAEVRGQLHRTGMAQLPVAFSPIERVTFRAAANPAIALRLQSTRAAGRVAELGSLGRMSAFALFAKNATRPVLIATAIVTTPAFLLLAFAIIERQSHRDALDPDVGVAIGLSLTFVSAIAGFVISCIIVLVFYFIHLLASRRVGR
jgi:hypothetical protein